MENYHMLYLSSSTPPSVVSPASSAILNMENNGRMFTHFLGNNNTTDQMGVRESKFDLHHQNHHHMIQEDHVDANNKLESGSSGRPSSKTKSSSGKKELSDKMMMKKHKYAFQTRSQVDILDDGSYYRCTHRGCNVKKQIQRLSKDEEVVVTTYEGIHTHPIEKSAENFDEILKQMQTYATF
ncbi:hypothetical protein FEM48_Zijuj05G0047000 [Ziziphus jujuba var. spinosa]|uniref:WRKY domain-containing protein n=1 Tax=Ziziphus jujuba var. spinosa TaxID=714518 RepID=A0A978VCW0_ZIZJJ|nr:hypothetical protein FEM48_Zijuj05G0047000 [Ziziphus jujuba var. spinosa]